MAANISVEDEGNTTNFDAMEFALNIPEILQMIMDRLDAPSTVKSARLVSYKWNDAVLSATKPLLILNLNKFKIPVDHEERILFSQKLFRKIVIQLPPDHYDQQRLTTMNPKNFGNICGLHGQFVENARFYASSLSSFPDFIIPALDKFPNLEALNINLLADLMSTDDSFREPNIISPKPNLVELTFHANVEEQPDGDLIMEELVLQLQSLINAAPNLKRFTLSENFYPDLTLCSKLQTLSWKGCPLAWRGNDIFGAGEELVESQFFDLEKLTILLNQVAQRLKVLKIDCSFTSPFRKLNSNPMDGLLNHGQIPNLVIPPMPNLTVFKTKSLVLSPFPGFSHFPLLRTLGLCQKGDSWPGLLPEEGLEVENRLMTCLPSQKNNYTANITKFKTDAIRSPDNYRRLNQIFPNLQEFSFWLRHDGDGEEEVLRFRNTMTFLDEMLNGMKKISFVKATLPTPVPDLREFFSRIRGHLTGSGEPGLKRLKVKMLYPSDREDDPQEMFDRFNLWVPLKSL